MSKRFTDTDIWDKEWFMALSCKEKCLVKLVRDKCDLSGVWYPNWMLASTYVGEKVDEDILLKIDNGNQFKKIEGNKIFCLGFIEFQYGKLSDKSPVHKKILNLLNTHKIPYQYSINRVKEEEEEKEEYKEEEKKGGMGENITDNKIHEQEKEIIDFVMKYFGFTEINNFDKLREITTAITVLNHNNRLEFFKKQVWAYKQFKELSKQIKHGFKSFLGTLEKKYEDGGWNEENWKKKYQDFEKKDTQDTVYRKEKKEAKVYFRNNRNSGEFDLKKSVKQAKLAQQ